MNPLIRFDDLLGRKVLDENGTVLGRIEDAVAVEEDGGCYVREFHLGPAALLQRLAISSRRVIGFSGHRKPVVIQARDLDLTDPRHPRRIARRSE